MVGTVYKMTNTINNDFYIGVTSRTAKSRFAEHKYNAFKRNNTSKLHQAMREFGVDNFDIEVIETCENASQLEKDLIKDLKPEYNTGKVGRYNPRYGAVVTQETRDKISRNNLGKQARLGAVLSEETKNKISKSQKERWAKLGGDIS